MSDGIITWAGLIGGASGPIGWAVAGIVAAVLGILDLFGVFGGGGSVVIPPAYYRHAHYIPSQFIGCDSVTPNQQDSDAVEAPKPPTSNNYDPNAPIVAEMSDANGNFPPSNPSSAPSSPPVNRLGLPLTRSERIFLCRLGVGVGCAAACGPELDIPPPFGEMAAMGCEATCTVQGDKSCENSFPSEKR